MATVWMGFGTNQMAGGELDSDPLPQWVLVTFTEENSLPGHTTVHLEHHGLGRSAQWDAVYEFFVPGWSGILYRLDRLQAAR